jgi:ribokinase
MNESTVEEAINHEARVIVVGSINMDLVVTTPTIPAPGETVLGGSFSTFPGGKGANQAVAARRAGVNVTMVGRLGSDAYGDQLRQGLVDEAVDVSLVGTCQHDPSGVALICVADSGENSIVVAPGANSMIRSAHVDDAVATSIFGDGSVLLVQLEIPIDVVLHAAQKAHAAGSIVIVNPAPAKALPDELWASVHIVIANQTEIEQLGGLDVLCAQVDTVIATLGSDGIEVHQFGEVTTIGALDVDVVDTTGAGDAFCGYFAAELANGSDVIDAAALANIAAGLSVSKLGARTSPTVAEVEAFVSR